MIRFEELRAGYDGTERLHALDYAVREGCLTALIGPNGCGKSTLLKCAAGILNPTGGRITLNNEPYSQFSRREMACRVSYMPQARPAPTIPVKQLVSHGRYPYLKWGHDLTEQDRKIVQDAMERTDTAKYARRLVTTLSGGERQRVYLAMMLAQQTPVMLLDEPTTYLDLGGQYQMMKLLKALRDEGRTILLVLHDLALALETADRVVLMQDGHLVESGTPDQVYASGKLQEVFEINVERTEKGRYLFSEKD